MSVTSKAYDELIDFLAAGTQPNDIIAFQPSLTTKERVANLLSKEKTSGITPEEKSELDNYLQLEHIMRLAKARARRYVTNG